MAVKKHRYQTGDIVGIVGDCMANCKILECVPKENRKPFTYVATAVTIHHPKPKESFFGQNKKFLVKEKQIVVKLS